MRETRSSGSVEGAMGNYDSYSDPIALRWTALRTMLHRLDRFVRRPHRVREIRVVDKRSAITVASFGILWRGRRIFRDGYLETLLQ
jgi:hypothetical protein